jgi:large-conductance mechanosensitive channel
MDRLDRSAVIAVAVIVMLGFATWQLANSIGYAAGELLIDWWEGDEDFGAFGAEFTIGRIKVRYGQVLASAISLLVALLIALPLISYTSRRRAAAPPPS